MNERIRGKDARVVDDDGKQLGILPLPEALNRAREKGLDLILIAPNENPPVCKIGSYGKLKYQLNKREKEARKSSKGGTVKEFKIRPTIGEHDFQVRIKHSREFLAEGNKVKITLMFRGREMAHKELGKRTLERLVETLSDVGVPEERIKFEGRNMVLVICPK